MKSDSKLCPSSTCHEGAILLGVVQKDGQVAYLESELRVDSTFLATAQLGRSPEKRFRFAGSCVQGACKQWTGQRCGIIDAVLEHTAEMTLTSSELPRCAIRAQCRWHNQNGSDACFVCPLVITDARIELVTQHTVSTPG